MEVDVAVVEVSMIQLVKDRMLELDMEENQTTGSWDRYYVIELCRT